MASRSSGKSKRRRSRKRNCRIQFRMARDVYYRAWFEAVDKSLGNESLPKGKKFDISFMGACKEMNISNDKFNAIFV